MSLSGSVSADFSVIDKRTIGLASNVSANPRLTFNLPIADGVGQGQANQLYGAVRTIPAGGADEVDLAGGLNDTFGGLLGPVRIKAVMIVNPAGNAPLVVGVGTNPETSILNATGTITIKPNGCFLIATDDVAAYPITETTADFLLVSGTAGQSYSLVFIGANA